MATDKIPVIDLFAGPGGLGEGFSAFKLNQESKFRICLSIEKDPSAYRTLRLRSFFRKIPFDKLKDAYVEFAKSDRTEDDEQRLFSYYRSKKKEVDREVLCKELGNAKFSETDIDRHIEDRLSGQRIWVLIGGPPCQAYSVAGRSRMSRLRKNNLEKFEKDERHRLYQHYLRIIEAHEPPVFVMENVKGLLSSTLKGQLVIDQIIRDLKHPAGNGKLRYNLYSFVGRHSNRGVFNDVQTDASDFLIHSEDFGIPQARHRLIILGVRSDIKIAPEYLKKAKTPVPLRSVISDLPKIRSSVSRRKNQQRKWGDCIREIQTLFRDGSFPYDLREHINRFLNNLDENLSTGGAWVKYAPGHSNKIVNEWYRQPDLGGVCNHEARSHMPSDLQRYYFAACFADLQSIYGVKKSPKLEDFPRALLPKHRNIDPNKLNKTVFSDRFRVQLWDDPAKTITSHIAKDGHYFIHPDPRQCRSLTVREAARIQTFPDSYIFSGTRTSQYQQVGNAVPPLLARQLAKTVYALIDRWGGR